MTDITSKHLHHACLLGATQVVSQRHILNKINVFPVRDGDTGNNLASMMRTILRESETKSTVKGTFESISDAALRGARGNSGIIFAQYLNGLTMELSDGAILGIDAYASASQKAVSYAYDAIESPVEGTMITVMKTWGNALIESVSKYSDIVQILSDAYTQAEESLKQTQFQLACLKKAGVVDSGAKGFVFFIKGILDYFSQGMPDQLPLAEVDSDEDGMTVEVHEYEEAITYRYCTEGFLVGENLNLAEIRQSLGDVGDSAVVAGSRTKCRVHIHTDIPAEVFRRLSKFGHITFQKADDMVKQQSIVTNRRHDIGIITDSIADLPQSYIDEHQVHQIHLNVVLNGVDYIDKLTVSPETVLDYGEANSELATSSQPSPKQVENTISYLSEYYDKMIILTVSSALSGTYNSIVQGLEAFNNDALTATVIDTKENSGAQGLLVKRAVELVESGMPYEQIIASLNRLIPHSKILVRVKQLNNMVKSGRLSTRAGDIGRFIGLKPIITLDKDGEGALAGAAFSDRGSLKKMIALVRKAMRQGEIDTYAIVHIDNLEEAQEFAEVFTHIIGKPPAYVCNTSSIIANGAGRGAVALSYIMKV